MNDGEIARAIERNGYAIADDFLAPALWRALAEACRTRELAAASIGRAGSRHFDASTRGDRTAWLDADDTVSSVRALLARLDALRTALNRALLLNLAELEAHFALYPAGAFYARHRDRFRDDDARVLSAVLYLNADWRDDDGGALRLHLRADESVDVAPHGGRAVFFLSDEYEHEVLPATRERLSVAAWFRRR
jgi:SM-20-related protein